MFDSKPIIHNGGQTTLHWKGGKENLRKQESNNLKTTTMTANIEKDASLSKN